jgi:hypothetical protein
MNTQSSTGADPGDSEGPAEATRRFLVRAGSVNAVRRALHRAPGGARVLGRYDRETIECEHTMDDRSFARNWPILVSRLGKSGLSIVPRHARGIRP